MLSYRVRQVDGPLSDASAMLNQSA